MEVVSGIIEMNVEVACNNEFMKRSIAAMERKELNS